MTEAKEIEQHFWAEYDNAAEWCAKRDIKGRPGDPLRPLLSQEVWQEINEHPESFEARVMLTGYALARARALNDEESRLLRSVGFEWSDERPQKEIKP